MTDQVRTTAFRCPDCNNAYEPTLYAGAECPTCLADLPSLPTCDRCGADVDSAGEHGADGDSSGTAGSSPTDHGRVDPRDAPDECPDCGWRR